MNQIPSIRTITGRGCRSAGDGRLRGKGGCVSLRFKVAIAVAHGSRAQEVVPVLPPGPDPPPNPGSGRWPSPAGGSAEDRAGWSKLINLQRRILPQIPPAVPGYRLALAYRPAFVVTGDYHDFFRRPDGNPAAFLGDGSGHGPAASMLMATMRTLLHTHDVHRDPGEALTQLGGMFHRLIPSDLFMTGLYLVLTPGGSVTWAAAGHHPPLWVTRSGLVANVDLTPVGPVLGFEPVPYQTVE